ncbi:rod shape-determining protein RodA [Marinilabiliaceae bacterium JC017]|nr:rod shape-determining protein RodA [Marinilabiliaceae bacterium JC017]
MVARNSYTKGIDWVTVLLYLTLIVFGWVNIYAANFNPDNPVFFDTGKEYFKQIIWFGLSLVLIGIVLLIDSKFYVEVAYIFYGFTLFLLLAVLLFGKEINGAKSWFEMGPVRFQPAELTKVATNLALARAMSRFGFTFKKKSDVFKLCMILFLPVIFILLQNDTGSALVYFVFVLMFYREGMSVLVLIFGAIGAVVTILTLMVPNITILAILTALAFFILYFKGVKREVLIALGVLLGVSLVGWTVVLATKFLLQPEYLLVGGLFAATVYLLYKATGKRLRVLTTYLLILWGAVAFTLSADYFFEKVLSDYQRTRINVLLGIEKDPLGAGYNVNQSMIAIGSGGVDGKGFLQGTQTKFDFVPEQSTDFIFCTVGEEWGFLGSTAVVLLFMALFMRLIYLAEKQHSDFSRIYGYGVAVIFFFHFAINMGMTIGLAPVIGIPLPFFSYGGSSLWGFTVLLFVFLKLDTNRNELIR